MKRKIALLISAAMVLSMFSSCKNGTDSTSAELDESVSLTAMTTAAAAAEKLIEAEEEYDDFFSGDYDPFADDYDPYGGSGAVAANHSPETGSPAYDIDDGDDDYDDDDDIRETPSQNVSSGSDTSSSKPVQSSSSNKNNNSKTDSDKKTSSGKTSDKVTLSLNVSNSWNDGSNDFIQLDGVISNSSSSAVDGWTVTIPASSKVRVDQNWNCDISLKNGTLTVTPVSYNSKIDPNGEGTFGMILCSAGKIDSSKSSVKFGTTTVSGSSSSSGSSGSVGNNNPTVKQAKNVPKPTTDDWLYVKGNKIVDKDGKEVWLTGVNWFGYNTGTNTFDGLWTCDLNTSIAAIADHGFNLLRIPISSELIKNWSNGSYPTANFNQATNSYLVGMNSLEIFDYVVGQCRANGIKIMIDIHCAKTDSMGHMKNMWYDGNISEKDYLDTLAWMAARYKNDDTIIAFDLENEPHGKANESPRAKWDGSKDADNWKYVAEKAAKAVLNKNPNVLVMVEGIEIYPKDIKSNGDFSSTNMGDYYCTWWGGNLRGVKDNPVDLGKYQNKLVYSPHDYGPTVYEQPWFKGGYTYESLYKDCWYDNWFYIQKSGTAPLLIGEWGGFMREPNLSWMKYMRRFIKENRINHTFWCFNSNSGDTGGLVLDDFTTWDTEKYNFVKEVLWQQDGKFVGLDHEIPLGSNGITLSQAK